jgi:gluconolactonase
MTNPSSIRPMGVALLFASSLGGFVSSNAQTSGSTLASVDLASADGISLMQASWRYQDAQLTEVDFRAADVNGQPTGAAVRTHDISPHAGVADFDDSGWQQIAPTSLSERRGTGRVSFNWYRICVTIPEHIGAFNPTGSTVWFETRLDDYAEVWVDGEIGRAYGQSGGSVVAGWNAPNRLLIGRHVKPGQQIQLAIFGMNGPISDAPTNYIFVREARLDFVAGTAGPTALAPHEVNVQVERVDPDIDNIVPPNAKLFKLAEGFSFTEGPVWNRSGGYLLFSDPNENTIYRYTEAGELTVFRAHSGYDGADIGTYRQPGSNGLTFDAQGRLTINEHGRRRVTRLEPDGSLSVLADRYKGHRLNSPNDLVYRSDGSVYFTDPPFGLPAVYDDPRKELPFSGVFRAQNGKLQLLTREFKGPNGIAFSPDEKFLYVSNWDQSAKVVKRFPVHPDGSLGKSEPFIDLTQRIPGEEALDGIKIDVQGNLYLSAPGGVWIFNSSGKHLGTIRAPKPVHNFAWGGRDGKELYLCARGALYRIPLLVAGARP